MVAVTTEFDVNGRFILLCLSLPWQPDGLALAQALAQSPSFSWDAVLEQAAYEEIEPLLYEALRAQPWLPPIVLERLQAAYMYNGSRNALLLKELEAMLAACKVANIPVLILKGAALAERVYGNIALRAMSDLDILLPRDAFPAAREILTRLGYREDQVEARAGVSLEYENEILLRKAGIVSVDLDIHWSLVDSPYYQRRVDMAWFWQSAQTIRLGAVPAQMLGAEAAVLHLCAHLTLHHRRTEQPLLLWQYDVAKVLHAFAEQLNWEEVLAKAEEYALILPLQQVLEQVTALWGTSLPTQVADELRRLQPSEMEVQVFQQLTNRERPVLRRFWHDLADMPDWRSRSRYALIHLFPSAAYMRQRYGLRHDLLLPFAYPYRWVYGFWEWLRS